MTFCCIICMHRSMYGLTPVFAHAGVLVEDAAEAYRLAVANGARGCLQPATLHCQSSGQDQTVAEVELYGDVRLRFVSGSFQVGAGIPSGVPPLACYCKPSWLTLA